MEDEDNVDMEGMLIRAILDKISKQKDVARIYRLAMVSDEKGKIDWGTINSAIIERWSLSGLKRIKNMAWSLDLLPLTRSRHV